jgi:hypothetical protein
MPDRRVRFCDDLISPERDWIGLPLPTLKFCLMASDRVLAVCDRSLGTQFFDFTTEIGKLT